MATRVPWLQSKAMESDWLDAIPRAAMQPIINTLMTDRFAQAVAPVEVESRSLCLHCTDSH